MLQFLKMLYSTIIMPPVSILLSLLVLAIWLSRRDRIAGRCLWAIVLLFYLTSIGAVGGVLMSGLEGRYSLPQAIDGDVIILLGGGATKDTPNLNWKGHPSGAAANRILTTAQLYNQLKVPIIISGGKVGDGEGNEAVIYSYILRSLGVPEDRIITEEQSLNTAQNAYYSSAIVRQNGFQRPILVTSAFHMERAVLEFEGAGIHTIPYPTDYRMNCEKTWSWTQLIPSLGALNATNMAMKEWAGIMVLKYKQ